MIFPYTKIAHHISWHGNNISVCLRTIAEENHKTHHRGEDRSPEFYSVPSLVHDKEHSHEHCEYHDLHYPIVRQEQRFQTIGKEYAAKIGITMVLVYHGHPLLIGIDQSVETKSYCWQ